MLTIHREESEDLLPTQDTLPRTPKLLFVDDDPEFQSALEIRLRDYDLEIERGFYGMQGIAEAIKSAPDLILSDMAMPLGNGEYLLECLKKNPATAEIPVIILTGMRDAELKHRMMQAGAEAFLNKPIHMDELLHQLGRFVDIRKRPNKENPL